MEFEATTRSGKLKKIEHDVHSKRSNVSRCRARYGLEAPSASLRTRLSGFIQRLVAFDLDRAEMDEHVLLPSSANRTVAAAVLRVKPLHRSQFHSSSCLFADATDQTSLSADAGLVWQFSAVNATNTRSTVEMSMRNWNRNASG